MSSRSLGMVLAAWLIVGPSGAAAQLSSVARGDSVKVRMEGAVAVEAIALAVQGPRLLLRTNGVTDPWPVSVAEIRELHVLRERTNSEGFRQGFGTGLVAGLFIGAAVGLGIHTLGWVGDESDPPAELLIHTTLMATGIGSMAGAFVGGFRGGSKPGMGWKEISLPRRTRQTGRAIRRR